MDGADHIVHPLAQQMMAQNVGELMGEDCLKLGVCQLGEDSGVRQQRRPQHPSYRDGRIQRRFQQGWDALHSQRLGALGGKVQEPLVPAGRAAAEGSPRQQQPHHTIGQK